MLGKNDEMIIYMALSVQMIRSHIHDLFVYMYLSGIPVSKDFMERAI